MASEHWEMDDFAAFVVFPSFRQLSAAGNPENPRGPGNGFRKRSEHCEMHDFATFVGFPSFRQGILRNGRFCCFCGVHLTSAAFGDRKSRNSKGSERSEEARKRPKTGQKRPGRGQKRLGRGQEEARKRPEEARKRPEEPEEAKAPKGQESRIWEKLLETQCFMNRK